MIGLLVIAGVVLVVLGVVATFGLGVCAMVRFARCDRCGHVGLTSATNPLRACTCCRYGRLLHPLYAFHRVSDGRSGPRR